MTATSSAPRVALVTGAAGGIGAAVARALAADGHRVALLDRDRARLAEVAAELRAAGATATTHEADVADPGAVRAAVRAAEAVLGPVHVLVSAAGVLRPAPVLATTDDDWAATFAVNATGLLNLVRAVVPGMVERGRGSVVTVASNAAGVPRTGMAAYAASKAAAAHLTRCLGLEVAGSGVRCNTVCPGSTDTAMQRDLWPDAAAGRRAALDGDPAAFRVGIPLARIADPQDVAEAVRFLASDSARHITMQDLYVDGGASLRA